MTDPLLDILPDLPDPDGFVLQSTPTPSTMGEGRAVVLGLASPWVEMRQDLRAVARDLSDPEVAGRWALDVLGVRYLGETSGGIPAEQWRRIVAAARVGIGSAGTYASLARFWRTLIGASEDTPGVVVRRIGAPGDCSVSLVGPVDFAPVLGWLSAAGRLVDAVVGPGVEWEAIVTRPDTAISGNPWSGYHAHGYPLTGGP